MLKDLIKNEIKIFKSTAPTPGPTITDAEVEIHLVPEGISETFQARCVFNATNAGSVRFNVSWYFDGVFYSSLSESLEDIQRTYIYLQRDNLHTLGRNVRRDILSIVSNYELHIAFRYFKLYEGRTYFNGVDNF